MAADPVQKLLSNALERLKNDKLLAAAVGGAAVAATAYTVSAWLASRDGTAYMTEEQKALEGERVVATSAGSSVSVRRLLPSDAASAAAVLAGSLTDDPLLVACSAESHGRESRRVALEALYRSTISTCLPSSSGAICLRTVSGDAVAIWLPNDLDLDVTSMSVGSATAALLRFAGWHRFGRLWLYSQAVIPRRKRLTARCAGKYYYLLISGAAAGSSSNSGSGSGAGAMPSASSTSSSASREAVILPVLEQADRTGVSCFVELTSPADIPLFTGLGFSIVDDFTVLGVPVKIMVREPAAAAASATAGKQ